jgi:hypothetical protein
MNRFFAIALCAGLAGCGPTLIGSNPATVMIGNVNWTNSSEGFALAERECQKYGRHARLAIKDPWSYEQNFDCVAI